jgi:hypothetical protein
MLKTIKTRKYTNNINCLDNLPAIGIIEQALNHGALHLTYLATVLPEVQFEQQRHATVPSKGEFKVTAAAGVEGRRWDDKDIVQPGLCGFTKGAAIHKLISHVIAMASLQSTVNLNCLVSVFFLVSSWAGSLQLSENPIAMSLLSQLIVLTIRFKIQPCDPIRMEIMYKMTDFSAEKAQGR